MGGLPLERSVVRILNSDGETLGTGFFCSARGHIITCHHVLPVTGPVQVRTAAAVTATIADDAILRFAAHDLALLRADVTVPGVMPLAAGALAVGSRVRTYGFQYGSIGVTSGFPLQGTVLGAMTIAYDGGAPAPQEVVVISGAAIDHGLSGAPLMDEESGVVVGVVVARFPDQVKLVGGGATLFATVLVPEIQAQLAVNRRDTPAFGRFANGTGIGLLCRHQTDRLIKALTASGHFLPDRAVDRGAVRSAVTEFIEGRDGVLSIVGDSGKGKTFALANIAATAGAAPLLFMRGSDVAPSDGDLSAAVSQSLQTAARSIGVPAIPRKHLDDCLRDLPRRLVIVLDGLNELPAMIRQDIDGWLSRSLAWLAATDVRWVLSSRPEFWLGVVPLFRQSPVTMPLGKGTGWWQDSLVAGDFSEAEANDALGKYQLPPDIFGVDDVRHPLMARAFWEALASTPGPQGHGTRLGALTSLLDTKTAAAARASDNDFTRVRRLLSQAAQTAYDTESYEIPDSVYYSPALFGNAARLGQKLIDEHVFARTPSGYRFSFDLYAELLIGERLSTQLLTTTDLPPLRHALGINALPFAVLKLEEAGQDAKVRTQVSRLLASQSEGDLKMFAAAGRLLSWLRRPEAVFDLIEAFCKTLPGDLFHFLLNELRLPVPETCRLLRIGARHERTYDWEPKHWSIPLSRDYGLGAVFERATRNQLGVALPELIQWFGDTSAGPGGPAVEQVAAGLMYRYRSSAFDQMCDIVIDRRDEPSGDILFRLADNVPAELIPRIERWIGQPNRRGRALNCLELVWRFHMEHRAQLTPVLWSVIKDDTDTENRPLALEILSRSGAERDTVWGLVTAEVKRGNRMLAQPSVLARYLESHYDEVLALMSLDIANGWSTPTDQINALASFAGSDDRRLAIIRLVRDWAARDISVAKPVAAFVESRLYQERRDSPLFTELLGLGLLLARTAPEEAQPYLAYASTTSGPDGFSTRQLALVDALLDADADNLELLLNELSKLVNATPAVWPRLERIIQELGPDLVLFQAALSEETTAVLVRWLKDHPPDNPAGALKIFGDAIEGGESPRTAARIGMRWAIEEQRRQR